MNEEIKEVLDRCTPFLFGDEVDKLLDYITNLQEENKRLKQFYDKKGVYSLEYDKETLTTMVCELQSKIDKAVDYLHHFDSDEICENITGIAKILINILEGSDKNER